MKIGWMRSAFLALAVAVLAGAGVAYATIPDSGGVYTACVQKTTGAVRLIDPAVGRCDKVEAQVTWNRSGKDGVSPTVTPLSAGDSHCPAGGAAITDAAGSTAYVCSAPASGTFTSPNGLFSLTVSDTGVSIAGPGASMSLDGNGRVTVVANDETVTVQHDRTESVSGNETITVGGNRTETVYQGETVKVDTNRTETVGGNETINVAGSRSDKVGGAFGLQVSGGLDLFGATVGINRSAQCKPVARVGDTVNPSTNLIVTGSPTLCID